MKIHGFTLIELMVALVVLLLLSTIAYANLGSFVIKSRRIEAQVALLELMQEQERHFSRHRSYVAFAAGAADPDAQRFKWFSGDAPGASAYELRGQACPGAEITHCIELLAIPGTTRVNASFADIECGTLSLDSTGRHGASGVGTKCWP
ncbi:MAG: type IV pilin protein [Pseudomonadota bacterium]